MSPNWRLGVTSEPVFFRDRLAFVIFKIFEQIRASGELESRPNAVACQRRPQFFLFLLGNYEVSNVVMLGFSYEVCWSSLGFQTMAGVLMGFSPVLHECRTSILRCDS